MKNDILELHYSLYIKKTLQKIHITKVSDLEEYDCLTLAKALPQDCNKALIIKKLNDLGYLPSAFNGAKGTYLNPVFFTKRINF